MADTEDASELPGDSESGRQQVSRKRRREDVRQPELSLPEGPRSGSDEAWAGGCSPSHDSREVIVIDSTDDDECGDVGSLSDAAGTGGADSVFAARLQRLRAHSADESDASGAKHGAMAQLLSAKQKRRVKQQRRAQQRQRRAAASTTLLATAGRFVPTHRRRSLSTQHLHGDTRPATRPLSARRAVGNGGSSASFRSEDGRLFPISLLRVSTVGVKHVVLLDGDNFPRFLLSLPGAMDDDTLVCCFVGGHTQMKVPNDALTVQHWNTPDSNSIAEAELPTSPSASTSPSAQPSVSSSPSLSPCARLVLNGRLLVTQCGCTPNAADFALAFQVGALHIQLPLHVPFTLFSGDKGLMEVLRHTAGRTCTRLDPHAEHVRGEKRQTDELNFALLQSITQR